MRYLSWALRILLFLLLFVFALKNTNPVTVRFYLGSQWESPLALVLLVFFAAGAVAGVAACLSHAYRQRREILDLRKELRGKSLPSGEVE
ncbi:MAG TPA: LapA family protein [Burkholderiales bacterium]